MVGSSESVDDLSLLSTDRPAQYGSVGCRLSAATTIQTDSGDD